MTVSREMPRYKSHKIVWALKIADVTGCTITPADEGYAPFEVDPSLYLRYTPTAGDYFVQYEDGYKSFSPAKAFEEGYTRLLQVAPTQARGLRITPEHIEDLIVAQYLTTADKAFAGCPLKPGLEQLSICVLVLKNGTKVVGLNYGAINSADHDAERGLRDARADAFNKVWELEGYLLRQALHDVRGSVGQQA